MKYATDHAFSTALEARINQAQSDSAGVPRLRQRIVFERFHARLVAHAPGEWMLKGGFALELRLGNVARTTKEADFEWRLDEEDATERLLDAAALDLGDRFTFALERADEETELPGGGRRWRVAVTLAGRSFERTSWSGSSLSVGMLTTVGSISAIAFSEWPDFRPWWDATRTSAERSSPAWIMSFHALDSTSPGRVRRAEDGRECYRIRRRPPSTVAGMSDERAYARAR